MKCFFCFFFNPVQMKNKKTKTKANLTAAVRKDDCLVVECMKTRKALRPRGDTATNSFVSNLNEPNSMTHKTRI